ncbi:MAG: tol-pal system protein YbgF [Betaproteobacteria bacterium]|nr:tol-pal system protein YbgF [Betaproteobacteria bacterium]
MPASSIRLAAAAIAFAAAGLAQAGLFDDDEARKRIDDIRAAQEKSARETSERIGRLEESVRNIGVVDLLRQIEGLNAEIARLRGSIEVLANQNEQIQKRQRDFYLDLDSRLKRLEGGGAPAQGAAAPASATPPAEPVAAIAKPQSKDDQAREVKTYDAASNLFRRNDFASASEAFRAFLKDFPQSALAPNATYWIGICQANLKDYKGALATQEGLLAHYPQSPKAPDALLAIAAVQTEQGDGGSARNTLEDIIARYPTSEAAGKARTRLAATRR